MLHWPLSFFDFGNLFQLIELEWNNRVRRNNKWKAQCRRRGRAPRATGPAMYRPAAAARAGVQHSSILPLLRTRLALPRQRRLRN